MSVHGKSNRYMRHSDDAKRWFGTNCSVEQLQVPACRYHVALHPDTQLLMKPFAGYEQPPALPLKAGNRAGKRQPCVLDPTVCEHILCYAASHHACTQGPLRRAWDTMTGLVVRALLLAHAYLHSQCRDSPLR